MRRRIRICGCRPATTSRSWLASLRASIRFASTSNGGSSFNGMAAEVRRRASIWMTTAIGEVTVLTTKRRPASVGEILVKEFMEPMGLTQGALADAMGVQRKHVNELCNNRRNVTAPTALILARVFGNSPDFWLNVQRRSDLWEAMHSPLVGMLADRDIWRAFARFGAFGLCWNGTAFQSGR